MVREGYPHDVAIEWRKQELRGEFTHESKNMHMRGQVKSSSP